ncbi:EamA family transporter [Pantoea ananatis]|uniref:EamA family transporter n=1 Tax=Pantoea ananas TaxID=553 RepID=UPI003FA45490
MSYEKLYAPFSIFMYCICTALSAVWISFSFSNVSGFVVTFFSLFVAFCVFVFLQKRSGGDTFKLSRVFFGDMLILNVLTLTSWLFAFLSLYKIEPSIECAVFQGSLPIGVLVCELLAGKVKIFSKRTLGIVLIAVNLFALVVFRLYYAAGVFNFTANELKLGVLLAVTGGLTAGFYVFRSAKLYDHGATTLEILCNRFFLLLIVTGIISAKDLYIITTMDSFVLVKLLSLAFISVVIPVFALQYSVQKLGAPRVSIITPFIPAIALTIEMFTKGWPSFWVPLLIVTTCLSILLANFWMRKKKPASVPSESNEYSSVKR